MIWRCWLMIVEGINVNLWTWRNYGSGWDQRWRRRINRHRGHVLHCWRLHRRAVERSLVAEHILLEGENCEHLILVEIVNVFVNGVTR